MRKYLLLIISLLTNSACAASQCSDNWYITGYYTPVESDFSSRARQAVRVKGLGRLSFKKDFIYQVKIEGWGKTRHGWYLGYYSKAWHKSDAPLDAKGRALVVGTIATDPAVIASGQTVTIPALYQHVKRRRFVAKDVGRNIRQRRIDVYTGEGHAAKKRAYRLTRRDHRICM